MPDVVGLTVSEAQNRVLAAGRNSRASSARAEIVGRRSDQRAAGQIIGQLDPVGQQMRPYLDDVGGKYGEVVFRVVLSTGPPAPTTFPMPKIVGLTVPDAEQRVLSAGRMVRARSARALVDYQADERPAGLIIEQLEVPGSPLRPNPDDAGGRYGEVTFSVIVSTGPQLAPDFLRQDLGEARLNARRQEVLLNVGDPVRDPSTPRGIVVRQEPAPGQSMSRRQVTVWPSAGYPLPNYINRPLKDARIESQKLGHRLEQRSEDNLGVPSGIIFEQAPPPGTLLPLDEPVAVKVSRGWPVPEFVGRSEPEAGGIADETRIRLNKTEQDNFEVPAGIIFYQQPPAANPLPPDRTVNVTISRGYPLPDLTGRPENDARQIAAELKVSLDISRAPMANRSAGHVDRQNPAPGTRLPLDRPVGIVVSAGWPTPNFLTLQENEANSLASEKQVGLTIAERPQDRTTQPGIVIGQDPLPGSLLPPGQAVRIVVSSGYPTPRLVSLAEVEARSLAAREGIVLDTSTGPSLDFATGVVTKQFPEPGAPLPADNEVSVAISSGWPTPDFVGMTEEVGNRMATDSKITLNKIAPQEHFELLPGLIAKQQPAAGAVIPPDRRVKISLSLGWPLAPDAVGQPASSVAQEFLGRHPNARVELSESMLTFEPAGKVISQQPATNVKLGPDQLLKLISSGEKPPWTWPVLGLFAFAAAAAAFMWSRPPPNPPPQPSSLRTEDPGGVRLRVTRDHGVQTTDATDGEIVKIRVAVDIGEQSAGPVEERGD